MKSLKLVGMSTTQILGQDLDDVISMDAQLHWILQLSVFLYIL